MKKLMVMLAMLAMVLVVAVPAVGQIDNSGNNNVIQCNAAQAAVQTLEAEITALILAGEDATLLQELLADLNQQIEQQCGVFLSDDDTINEGDEGDTINEGDRTTITSDQEFEQDAESGDIDTPMDVAVEGDNSNACMPLQSTNATGNPQDELGIGQQGSGLGEAEFAGDETAMSPELNAEGTPTLSQEANAS